MQNNPQQPLQQPQQQYAQQPYPPPQYAPNPQYPIQQVPQQYPAGYPQYPPAPAPTHRSFMKDALVFVVAGIAAVYLLWPSLVPDFVPDFLPFVGQLDDDTAMLVILSCFRYFGFDLTNIFMGLKRLRGQPQQPPQQKQK
jgi:hypothetical protein